MAQIFKVLIVAKRIVKIKLPKGVVRYGGKTYYEQEEKAYSDYFAFSSIEKAKGFVQQYSETPLEWSEIAYGCTSASAANFDGLIYIEDEIEFDTTSKPPLPTKFSAPADRD